MTQKCNPAMGDDDDAKDVYEVKKGGVIVRGEYKIGGRG